MSRRRITALGAIALAIASWACADKVLNPRYSMSPKVLLQVVATGVPMSQQAGTLPKMIVVVAAYTHDVPRDTISFGTDSFVPLSFVTASARGGSQQVSLPVDLSRCLADPTRHGTRDGCSIYIAVALRDSAQISFDSGNNKGSDPFSHLYDLWLQGPFNASPGQTPTLPAIDLSVTRFAVHEWVNDEALRLGGPETPSFFSGPISGVGGTSPTLFAVTQGGCNVGQLAIFQSGRWRRVPASNSQPCTAPPQTPPNVPFFSDVAAFASNDVYIAAFDGLSHYDGTSTTPVSAVRDQLRSVAIVSVSGGGKYIVAGTQSGGVWLGNGTTFQKYTLPSSNVIDQVCITGPTEAFAASTSASGIYRFDGSTWTSVPLGPQGNKFDLQCLAGPPSGLAWVYAPQQQGPSQGGPFFRWNVSGWSPLPNTGLGQFRGYYLGVSSASEAWVVGDSGSTDRSYYRFDGTTWKQIARRQVFRPTQHRIWANPPAGGAAYLAMSAGRVERMDANGVSVVSYQPSMRDAIMTSAQNAFAVGASYFLARWNGSRWSVDTPPQGALAERVLNGVWSDGPSNAWAVGDAATIAHWDGSKWTQLSDSLKPIVSASNSYSAVWGSGGSVWITGSGSILRCTSVNACATDPTPGTGVLFSIWGTSASNAFAVGAGGRILHFDGTSWTPMSSPTSLSLKRVWGVNSSNVLALGDSVLIRYDGTSWKNVPLPSGLLRSIQNVGPKNAFQLGLWGTGPNELYIGTAAGILAYDGLGWKDVGSWPTGRVVAITGYPGGCAIAVTDGLSNGFPGASNLLRGVGPTGCLGTPMTPPLTWP